MMSQHKNWLKPEEALTRFKKPKSSLLANNGVSLADKSNRYGFEISNVGFLMAETSLAEVVKNAQMFPIPNTKKWLRGLINLRGNLVPVYDLSLMTGLKTKPSKSENLLVLGSGVESVAIVIDNLPRSCDVSLWEKMESVPCSLNGLEEHVTEVYAAEDMVWINFDEKKYFQSMKSQITM